MRALLLLFIGGVALGWTAVPAQADVKSYCEAYARHEADKRVSGGAILGGVSAISAAERNEREVHALADCLALYTPKTRVEPAKAEVPVKIGPEPPKKRAATPAAPMPRKKSAVAKAPAAKIPEPEAKKDSVWDSFDNPGLPVSR